MAPRAAAALDWWLGDRARTPDPRTGRRPRLVGQWPNAAISVFLVLLALRWGLDAAGTAPATLAVLEAVGRGALVVWGVDELVRGRNPFRRAAGALVLGWQLVSLVGA